MATRYGSLIAAAALASVTTIAGAPASGQSLPHTLESPNAQLFGSFGLAVDRAGDVNGDGRSDVIVGADGEEGPTGRFAGRAYVFDGTTGHVLHVLESPQHESGSYFGTSVAGLGDVDGDGTPDVVVGARAAVTPGGAPSGRAFVFSGADGTLIHDLVSPDAQAGGSFGLSVASTADVNADGRPDVVVGAGGENTTTGDDAGRAYVYDGATGALLRTLESPSAQAAGLFGQSVAGVGDVDGDGRGDIAVGAVNEHNGSGIRGGRVHLFSGASGAAIRSFDSSHTQTSGRFGVTVASAGDTDGDAVADILVGAPGEQPAGANSGRAYLFSGLSGGLLREFVSPNTEPTGFFGGAVAGVGDLDGDELDDILIAGAAEDTPSGFGAGRAYAFSGATGGVLFSIESPNGQQGGVFGSALAGAGDVDGDSRPELLIGAMGESTPEGTAAGRAYVMPAPVVTVGSPVGREEGLSVEVEPNPAHSAAAITFILPSAHDVSLSVVDALGRNVAHLINGPRPAGVHRVQLPGLPAGVYLAHIRTPDGTRATRFTIVR